jgi:DNA-binding beta-propeller fold protein YncE
MFLIMPRYLDALPGITVENVTYGKSRDVIFNSPVGIFYDSRRGEVYVTDAGSSSLLIFNSQGDFLFSFPHWVRRGGRDVPGEPRDIVVNSRGVMFLTDALSQEIDLFNTRGVKIDSIDPKVFEVNEEKTAYPQYMAIDQWDTLYVTLEGDSKEIVILDPASYKVVRRIEGVEGGFGILTGIALDKDQNIMITDILGPYCVQVYSKKGDFLLGFGQRAIGDENFSHPRGLACTGDGDMWVVDSFRQVVKRFSQDGSFKEMVGGMGIMAGDLQYPFGIVSDLKQKLYIVEKVGRRFQILRTN